MPVKIRLRRMGAKHQPSYRIVVADSRSPRDGRYIDQVGFYDPLPNPAVITIDADKAKDWLRRGAQPTETVEIPSARGTLLWRTCGRPSRRPRSDARVG